MSDHAPQSSPQHPQPAQPPVNSWPAAPAPAPPVPVPPSAAPAPGIHLFAWRLWWWMSWLMPALFVFSGFFSGGGWIAFALLLFSWVILPIAGLLGMLPQIVLRRRGYRSAPGPVTWLLFLNWWSWFAMVVSLTDFGDTDETTSFVRTTLGLPITETGEQVIFVIAVFVAILSWIAVLVLSFTLRRTDAVGAPAAPWTPLAWATAFGAPALLILGVATGSVVGAAS